MLQINGVLKLDRDKLNGTKFTGKFREFLDRLCDAATKDMSQDSDKETVI